MLKEFFLASTFLFVVGSLQTNAQGYLWGSTLEGGHDGAGVIFRMNADGSNYTVMHELDVMTPGDRPWYTKLTKTTDGRFYGMTAFGGKYQQGVIFEFDPLGQYIGRADFELTTTGGRPKGSLIQASNGMMYGMTTGGGVSGDGALFEFDPTTLNVVKKVDFDQSKGTSPSGSLLEYNGKLYGMTETGGNGYGTIFEYDLLTGNYQKLFDFSGADGGFPKGSLIRASDGLFYGLTSGGGSNGWGTLFSLDLTSLEHKTRVHFSFVTHGATPTGSLTEGPDGKLYGMTSSGGSLANTPLQYDGTLFAYDPVTDNLEIKVDFEYHINGSRPFGDLLLASNGKFYGMNSLGGLDNGTDQVGVLFEYSLQDGFVPLHYFKWDFTGSTPYGSVIESDGMLYGLTQGGGINMSGVLFEYDIANEEYRPRVNLNIAFEGRRPWGGLTLVNDKLFGVTNQGGLTGHGTIFLVDTLTGELQLRADFFDHEIELARYPYGKLVLASNGKLYCVTDQSDKMGAILEFWPGVGLRAVGHAADIDGNSPEHNLTLADNGKLYGVTLNGGDFDGGIIFEYDPENGQLAKRFSFNSATSGVEPACALIAGKDGKLYGLTRFGGDHNSGTIFTFDPATNAVTELHNIKSIGTDNTTEILCRTLVYGKDGQLYGASSTGGAHDVGFIFRFNLTTKEFVRLHDFSYTTGAYINNGNLTQTPDGSIFGMTVFGGEFNEGVIFKFNPSNNDYSVVHNFRPDTGSGTFQGELLYVPDPSPEPEPSDTGIVLFPNPTDGDVNLEGLADELIQVSVTNALGQRVFMSFTKTTKGFLIQTNLVASGFYILRATTSEGEHQFKLIKK